MKKLNMRGEVAMISVVIFSIIITIVVTAYARTVVSQQRGAISYDLGTRAFYAAESGVQDAIRELKKVDSSNSPSPILSSGQKDCKASGGYLGSVDGVLGNSAGSLAYTCQLVDSAPGELTGSTGADSALWKIDPAKAANSDYKLRINWSNPKPEDLRLVTRIDNSKLLPPVSGWSDSDEKYHPMLRVSFISAPDVINNRDQLHQQVFFLNPAVLADPAASINPNAPQSPGDVLRNSSCDASPNNGGFKCAQDFILPSSAVTGGNNLYMVIHSVYGNTNYQISVADRVSGEKVDFKNTAISIDVTARAGDVFRRVKQQVPLEQGYQESWFDASGLVVGDGICKLFSIGTTTSQFSSQCNPMQL